jgi:ADP-ribose pyrophosphatase YjhB (NUDIX family)
MGMDWPHSFHCCYHCGHREMRRLAPSVMECRDCRRHLFINPVSAVAGILLDAADRVLLIQRAKEPAKGKLSLPGGFLDPGETAEEGLAREIREETGIILAGFDYVASFPNRYVYDGAEYMVLDLFFSARLKDFDDAAALDEVDAIHRVPLSEVELDQIAFPSVARALAGFREARLRPGIN